MKTFLKQRSMAFQEVSIEEGPDAEDIVLQVNHGKRKIPTLKVGEGYFACSAINALPPNK